MLARALAALLLLVSADVHAQACCAGANAITPGRLALHEDALVGLLVRGGYVLGSFDALRSRYVGARAQDSEADFDQSVIGTLRVAPRAQVSAVVPLVQTYRSTRGTAEAGGGLGDIVLSGRYDFVLAGESLRIPGIALLAAVTAPTGTPPERAQNAQATDATGVGSVRLAVGAALEQQFGPVLVNVTGTFAWAAPRTVPAGRAQDGLAWSVFGAVGWVFKNTAAVAVTGAYSDERGGTLDGMPSGTGKASTRLGLAGGSPITDAWRVSASAYLDVPASGLGRNQTAQSGLTFLVIRSWS